MLDCGTINNLRTSNNFFRYLLVCSLLSYEKKSRSVLKVNKLRGVKNDRRTPVFSYHVYFIKTVVFFYRVVKKTFCVCFRSRGDGELKFNHVVVA